MRTLARLGISIGTLAASFMFCACSDDTAAAKSDAGAAQHDSGVAAIPRLDAAVSGDDPLPACDRFNPSACKSGQVCDELIRMQSSSTTVIYASCVDAPQLRALGDPCDPWSEKYETQGLLEPVFLDPCGDGTICEKDPLVRGASSCQPICQSGTFKDTRESCASRSAYCFGPGQYEEVCIESDGCDVAKQTGCPKGKACYLQLNDSQDGALSVCLPVPQAAVADQQRCTYVNDCKAGSSCFGPVHLAPSKWSQTDSVCRPACSTSVGVDDAGTDDAGAGCFCEPYSASGLDFLEIPKPPFGQCE